MHLALVIDDYLPDSTRVGAKMFHELALQLLKCGHQVTVITPSDTQEEKIGIDSIEGVNIWRFKSGKLKDIGKVKRAINETLLSFNAWGAISSLITPSTFDGVIYYSPSIFFGSLIKRIKSRCNCQSYLILRDLFPQWVIDAGMIKQGSLIAKYFRFFENYSYAQADMIGLMSDKNLDVFNSFTEQKYSGQVLRNWASLIPHRLTPSGSTIRKRLSLEGKVIFFYGGNIGHAQDMSNLMRLVKSMRNYSNAHFLFVGQGDEVDLINRLAVDWNLENFSYLPSVNQDEFKEILTDIDVGLFSLSPAHTAHNFPGKLLGYMVQSKPILGSVNDGNDLMELINSAQAGCISINGNDELLVENAIKILKDEAYSKSLGMNGYQLLSDEFSVESISNTILQELQGANK
jgi:glycosyltransferase involved in cell wall biosynthesis